ncbi:MAG TPA: hypothetical protein VEU30_16400 [Thermoanaerobaculia bacterium]|nr:hypothetical protein [Thermoanaerobaculia bacterium]
MRSRFLPLLFVLAACGATETADSPARPARNPVSVRGWVTDVAGAVRAETYEQEIARRTQLFASSSVWVEKSEFSSGGISENGAFIILDVPPGSPIIGFNSPGAEQAKIVLQNIPDNADVFIPNVILENGGAKVLDPKAITIRVSGSVDTPRPTGQTATVAGHSIAVMEVPYAQLEDRREYPNPGGFRPVATVK